MRLAPHRGCERAPPDAAGSHKKAFEGQAAFRGGGKTDRAREMDRGACDEQRKGSHPVPGGPRRRRGHCHKAVGKTAPHRGGFVQAYPRG